MKKSIFFFEMNFILFLFWESCLSDNVRTLTHSGFASIVLNPKEAIEIKNINTQSIFLFSNPDPRIFKLEVYRNNKKESEPFSKNGPILDSIKFDQISLNNIDYSNSKYEIIRNAKLLSENIEEKVEPTPINNPSNGNSFNNASNNNNGVINSSNNFNNPNINTNNGIPNNDNQNNQPINNNNNINDQDLVFGIFIGSKGYSIKITGIKPNTVDKKVYIPFYYLSQRNKAHQIYLSTYPNDVFSIGKSPEDFDICKLFNQKLISYWNVPGEKTFYETNSINQSKSSKIRIINDNKILLNYSSQKSLSTTKVTGDYLYFDWITDEVPVNCFYKVLVRNKQTVSNYIEKYRSEGMDRYSKALKNNNFTILPPTRYQFIRPMYVTYINAKHRYGQFSRKKDVIPLTSLNKKDKNESFFVKTAVIIVIAVVIIVLAIFSAIDKIQSVSYSAGFGDGKRRKVRRRVRKTHKNIKEQQENNTFGLDYCVEDNINESDEEEQDIDDGNLSMSKKKKRSPEMNGIMEEILENKK